VIATWATVLWTRVNIDEAPQRLSRVSRDGDRGDVRNAARPGAVPVLG
jgi:hypothetical protein